MGKWPAGDLRFVDVEREPRSSEPPHEFSVQLHENERIVAVETLKDPTGYARARVWIVREAHNTDFVPKEDT